MNAVQSKPKEEKPRSAAHQALVSLGISKPSETPLLVPLAFEDFQQPAAGVASLREGTPTAIVGRVVSDPTRSHSGPPRHTFQFEDSSGETTQIAVFGGEPTNIEGIHRGASAALLVVAKDKSGTRWVTAKEVIEPQWVGRVRPVYPVKKSGGMRRQVRHIVHAYLPNMVSQAATQLTKSLAGLGAIDNVLAAVGCRGWSMEQLLWQLHEPANMKYAEHARQAYIRMAALGMRLKAYEHAERQGAAPLRLSTVEARVKTLPYTLTGDQQRAISDIVEKLGLNKPLHHVLSGEVGTGKSMVAYVLAACTADLPRGRTLIMAPTYPLATQLHREFTELYPDVSACFVAADSDARAAATARLVVATSAVLSRDVGRFSLVIVDEQQRWSRKQREAYVKESTHLVEMSATCIPRTQALIRLGHVTTSEMRQTHAEKRFITTLWEGEQGVGQMFGHIKREVGKNHPVVIIYPKKESGSGNGKKTNVHGVNERHSIEQALPRWGKMFPGRVRAVTGSEDNEAKEAALKDIAEGAADILLATTVVEVGITLPNLYRIVIVHPERYGLTTLHQLRGRVARQGGDGYCELWAPEPLAPKARERLETFVNTSDGFALAEADLKIRGAGNLSPDSEIQSGADNVFTFGAPVSYQVLEEVEPIWIALMGNSKTHP